MKTTKKQFLADVMHEIEMLKTHATDEEKNGLDFRGFDPDNAQKCIYGQMTGDCRTQRAFDLMELACKRTFDLTGSNIYSKDSVEETAKKLNGAFNGQGWNKRTGSNFLSRDWSYLSALEGYIQLKINNGEVIAYIKGEIDTLKL